MMRSLEQFICGEGFYSCICLWLKGLILEVLNYAFDQLVEQNIFDYVNYSYCFHGFTALLLYIILFNNMILLCQKKKNMILCDMT